MEIHWLQSDMMFETHLKFCPTRYSRNRDYLHKFTSCDGLTLHKLFPRPGSIYIICWAISLLSHQIDASIISTFQFFFLSLELNCKMRIEIEYMRIVSSGNHSKNLFHFFFFFFWLTFHIIDRQSCTALNVCKSMRGRAQKRINVGESTNGNWKMKEKKKFTLFECSMRREENWRGWKLMEKDWFGWLSKSEWIDERMIQKRKKTFSSFFHYPIRSFVLLHPCSSSSNSFGCHYIAIWVSYWIWLCFRRPLNVLNKPSQ